MILAETSVCLDMEALRVLKGLLEDRIHTLAIRPITEDTPWIKTLWPNENYL